MLTIEKPGEAAGVKVPTIRYCKQIGLLPEAERGAGSQRVYSSRAVVRLTFICHARELGFPLDAIRNLPSLSDRPDHSCAAADAIAQAQLAAVDARIARLTALKSALERMVVQCAGGVIRDCRVIEVLGDHAQCGADHRHVGQDAA